VLEWFSVLDYKLVSIPFATHFKLSSKIWEYHVSQWCVHNELSIPKEWEAIMS